MPCLDTGTLRRLADQVVDGGQGHAAELCDTVFLGANDPVDDVVAASRLAVVARCRRQDGAVGHVDQIDDNRGRAHIDRQPQ